MSNVLIGRDFANDGVAHLRDDLFDAVLTLWQQRQAEGVTIEAIAARIERTPRWVHRHLSGPGEWTLQIAGELIQGLDGQTLIRVTDVDDLDAELYAPLHDPNVNTEDWRHRIANYHRVTGFPESLFIGGDGRAAGIWIMGNDYRVTSGYYGGYPATYLRRVKALFPDKHRVLHLFSGKVDLAIFPGDTVDINATTTPTYVDDAQSLLHVPLQDYDLVLADPPYSIEDAVRYQTSMIKRNVVMKALSRLSSGAHIVFLDQVLCMYRKDTFCVEAHIGLVRSTNHRFRVVTVFRRL